MFFDGTCGFCDRSVTWIIDRDVERRFHFAPLQGEVAGELRDGGVADFPRDIDTLVYAERAPAAPGGFAVRLRSSAVFAIAAQLPAPICHWARLAFLPRALTDLAYRGSPESATGSSGESKRAASRHPMSVCASSPREARDRASPGASRAPLTPHGG